MNKKLPDNSKIIIRPIKYLNNIVEQDHRPIKKITRPMLGFKPFAGATETLAGIELQRMLKKDKVYLILNFLPGSSFMHWRDNYVQNK